MGDRLGISGAVDFCLLFSFFIIYIFIIIIKLFLFSFFLFDNILIFYFYINKHEFLNSEQKKRFLNAEASFCGHSSYILQFKNNDNYFKI